jgi:flap endonuclease-1
VGNIYVKVEPELIDLDENLKSLEITREQLIMLGMLVGTDYNPKGIPKIGPKTALKLVKEFETPERLFEHVKWKEHFDIDWKIIYEFFLNPKIKEIKYEFKEINESKIIELLCKKHEFNEDRVKKILNELKEKKKQTNLSDWF